MFWGLVLRANKRYSQTVSKTFHLSQATLDVSQPGADADIQVTLNSDNENYILCTLSKKKDVLQVPLDLVFSEGDEISFSANGVVHLTGYLIPNDEFDGFGAEGEDEELDEEEQEDDEEVPELVPAGPKKLSKKQLELKKLLEAELQQDDEEDSDFDEEAGDDEDVDEEDDDEDDDDEEADDDSDDDEEEEEEEIAEPVTKKQKQSNGVANGKAEKVQPKKQEQPQQKVAQPEPKEKTLQGGVKVEDIRVGKGPEAKPGKKVQVYYEGRLKSNNKVFDSSKSGQGFSFNLGRGEVIRGWDLGVAGMKVGSKRRITCPPAMAYGAKGSPPVIPANSTLIFDVELRNVK